MSNTGYIYVLTNESFHRDNWIKIGYLILFKFVENIADLWYYNSDLSESSLDHRRREEFPVIFFGVNDYERT